MRRACLWLAVVAVGCGPDEQLGIDASTDAAANDAMPPCAANDAMSPDATGVLLPLIATGADLGVVEAGVTATGFVRFDNNSGADVVITTASVTGADYTIVGSSCT